MRMPSAEVLRSLEGWAESHLLPMLKPVDRTWQPHDLLPDSCSPGFREEVDELRARARRRSPTTTTWSSSATW
jgi:acyl-[acyl-carrier-protein] desaturase